jgi:hypothetical protein
MKISSNNKLITCIMPRGTGPEIVEALHAEHGIASANVINGRGVSERKRYFAEEVDVLMVTVNQSQADEIFDYIHERAGVGTSRGRLMFQQNLSTANSFEMPDIPLKEGDEASEPS